MSPSLKLYLIRSLISVVITGIEILFSD